MTTVGYGDVYPATPVGRGIVIACVIVGAFLLGLVINIISNIFELSD